MSKADAPNYRRVIRQRSCEYCIFNTTTWINKMKCSKYNFSDYKEDSKDIVCDSWEGVGYE